MLVNDIWGGERLMQWDAPVWEHDLDRGLRMLRLAIDTHLITSHFALASLIRRPGGLVVDGSRSDCWRYLVEVQDAGRPADPTGYR